MSGCRLCKELSSTDPKGSWNKPLIDFGSFVVLPSLGALLPGWLLLVPKQHAISLGALQDSATANLNEFKNRLAGALEQRYGSVCAFEHGPSRENCLVGCGVDHAHLHLVPFSFDLCSAVAPYLPPRIAWSQASFAECQAAHQKGLDYLYLEQPIGYGRIVTHPKFGSQVFRRGIAARLGISHKFNWREYPEISTVLATVEEVKTWTCPLESTQPQL